MENLKLGESRAKLMEQAESFIRQCYAELELTDQQATERIQAIHREVEQSGTYIHTEEELTHGAKMAWRNNSRCIGRLFW